MPLLTQAELHPLQEARRVAEEHLDAIRQMAIARRTSSIFDCAENQRYHLIAGVVGALQAIYDNVSELEFEEEEPEEPPKIEEDDDFEDDDDEDEDDED